MLEKLRQSYLKPSDEYTPIPFWFWNDTLEEGELLRQIHDFKSKGVMGFVIHPRMGIPESIGYLSDRFMEMVKIAVDEAARLGMKVILYDEAMYPSGSAQGMVVKGNPEYAARGLRMTEHVWNGSDEIFPILLKEEKLIAAQAVRKVSEREIEPESVTRLECVNGRICFDAPDSSRWSVLIFTETYSKGTIRGIHPGEDDGEPGAPPAGDLMNPEAMNKFIALTHERYYAVLKEHFGKTVIAMFTDEPNVLGRCAENGLQPWTAGFADWYKNQGGNVSELPFLWFDAGRYAEEIRKKYKKAVNKRLEFSYYQKISQWCQEHNIALTGHPHESDEIGFLKYFHIPGQDIVWRMVGPEDGKGLEGPHSTMAKCSSDAARHRARRRNSNECFGCCGPDGIHWAFSVDDMKWYLDWLFARGVNLIYPHAFYYSVRGEIRSGERPPDVGPNNLWWGDYERIAEYIKRMSWLLTDSHNVTDVAVLCEEDRLPWKIVKPLYQNQMEFNYLENSLFLLDSCHIADGCIKIEKQRYFILVIEDADFVTPDTRRKIMEFIASGGHVVMLKDNAVKLSIGGIKEIDAMEDIAKVISSIRDNDTVLDPPCKELRVAHVVKGGVDFYLLVNEGEDEIQGELNFKLSGRGEIWDAFSGRQTEIRLTSLPGNGSSVSICIPRRESRILCVDSSGGVQSDTVENIASPTSFRESSAILLNSGWWVQGPGKEHFYPEKLVSWTQWTGMEDFSGTLAYNTSFWLEKGDVAGVMLELGNACELVRLYVNNAVAGVKMWAPYTFDITEYVKQGDNSVRVEVTNSIANKICKAKRLSGLLGPVRIILNEHV